MEELMETQTTQTNTANESDFLGLDVTGLPTMEELERKYLNLVLEKTGGNKVQAAKILGVSVKTIYNKLDSYRDAEAAKQGS